MLAVYKFGGSSLQSPAHIQKAANRIASNYRSGTSLVVVVSAMGTATDELLRLARETVRSPGPRELDMLLTSGERVSMSLLAMALEELGIPAISFTGSQSGIVTDNCHGDARILEIRPIRIQEALAQKRVVIIAGFQGVSSQKEITTLGRGGSDTTAVALAAALSAQNCIIFTDVAGLYSADPRLVPSARHLPVLSYDEALELSYLGAKMHPRSIELARRRNVPLFIRSSFEKSLGTEVCSEGSMEQVEITAITNETGLTYWSVESPAGVVTTRLAKTGVTTKLLNASSRLTQFVCKTDSADAVGLALNELNPTRLDGVGVLSAVGHGVPGSPSVSARFLETLDQSEILLVSTGSLSVSAVVRAETLQRGLAALHREFIER